MPKVRRNPKKLELQYKDRARLTSIGGLLLVEAVCRRAGLCFGGNFACRPAETIIAQLLFGVVQGGVVSNNAIRQ